MVDDLHHRNVRVFFPNMPWDPGTRLDRPSLSETRRPDGGNWRRWRKRRYLRRHAPRFRIASDQTGHPLAFEPEGSPEADEKLDWNNKSWGYWKYPFVTSMSRGSGWTRAT